MYLKSSSIFGPLCAQFALPFCLPRLYPAVLPHGILPTCQPLATAGPGFVWLWIIIPINIAILLCGGFGVWWCMCRSSRHKNLSSPSSPEFSSSAGPRHFESMEWKVRASAHAVDVEQPRVHTTGLTDSQAT